jgi:iron complex outermembrane receptor protein
VSPMAGLVWKVRPLLSWYANVASAFETPTITELTNQPDGNAGVNPSLAPQRTLTYESGVQGIVLSHVRLDAAAFLAQARDELVPFDVPGAVGRRAYRNAGRTRRTGVEGSATIVSSWGESGVSYAYSHFRFVEYVVGTTVYNGKPIPGVPAHQAQGYVTGRWPRGWFTTAEVANVTKVSVDDGASAYASGWTTVGLRVGHTTRGEGRASRLAVDPVVGVDNLFDRRYASAVVVNATRNRYYEPGARRRVYAGLRVGATPFH